MINTYLPVINGVTSYWGFKMNEIRYLACTCLFVYLGFYVAFNTVQVVYLLVCSQNYLHGIHQPELQLEMAFMRYH